MLSITKGPNIPNGFLCKAWLIHGKLAAFAHWLRILNRLVPLQQRLERSSDSEAILYLMILMTMMSLLPISASDFGHMYIGCWWQYVNRFRSIASRFGVCMYADDWSEWPAFRYSYYFFGASSAELSDAISYFCDAGPRNPKRASDCDWNGQKKGLGWLAAKSAGLFHSEDLRLAFLVFTPSM